MMQKVCLTLIFMLCLIHIAFTETTLALKAGINITSFRTVRSVNQQGRSIGGGFEFALAKKMSLGIELLNSQRTSIIENKIIGGWPVKSVKYRDLYCSITFWQVPMFLKYDLYQNGKFQFQPYGGIDFSLAKKDNSYQFNERYIKDIADDVYWEHTYYDYEYADERLGIELSSGFGYCFGLFASWSTVFIDIRYLNDLHYVGKLNGGSKSYSGSWNVYNLQEKMHSVYVLAGITFILK